MTELNKKNRELYLDVCKTIWNLDDKSMDYIAHRTSDEWEPVPELKALIGINGSTYEDQRIRFDIDMANPGARALFEKDDGAYATFKGQFKYALRRLSSSYGCNITYGDFINNKAVFNKNTTKIKKILETVYKENIEDFASDFGSRSQRDIADYIVRAFERIGASKKSSKKLQLVISFNPMDWLLASTSESFSSCFNIANESGGYQYCLGLPFLCGDKNRMMLYITNGAQKECMGIKVDSVQTRTWCILEKSSKMAIVKWYPNDTVGVSPVNLITGTDRFISRDYFSCGKYAIDMLSTKKGACIGVYSDMGKWVYENGELRHKGNGKDGQQWFTNRGTSLNEDRNRGHSSFRLENNIGSFFGISNSGYNLTKWKELGFNVDMMFREATCTCCKKESTGFFSSIRGGYKFYCKDCYVDNIFTCGSCGESKIKTEKSVTVETTIGTHITICEDCASRIKERVCDCCGKYSLKSLKQANDGHKFCKECIDSGETGYISCGECGTLTKDAIISYNTFEQNTTITCNSCYRSNQSEEAYATFGKDFRLLTRRSLPRGRIE